MLGSQCLFRHEHRGMSQLHRRHYTAHYYAYESFVKNLCENDKAEAEFLENNVPQTSRLSVFADIHDQGLFEWYQEHSEASSDNEAIDSISELSCGDCSDIEDKPSHVVNNQSSLNTTQDSGDNTTFDSEPASPAKMSSTFVFGNFVHLNGSDAGEEDEVCDEQTKEVEEDLDMSLRSLGLDFV